MSAYASSLQPITRRQRFYRDPNTNAPEVTFPLGIHLAGRDRFVLAQAPVDGGAVVVVADSAGLIPVFASQEAARSYAERFFPLRSDDPGSADAVAAAQERIMAGRSAVRIDLDALRAWADDPFSDRARPLDAVLGWELLAGADAAPVLTPFDPMGAYGLVESFQRGEVDSVTYAVAIAGMKVSGLVAQAERSGGADALGWPADTSLWTASDRRVVAAIMRRGIDDVAKRLSREAARRDVKATWARPAAPALVVRWGAGDAMLVEHHLAGPDQGYAQLIEETERMRYAVRSPHELGISAAAYARYREDWHAWVRDRVAYLRLARDIQDAQRRTVRVSGTIANEGDLDVENVSVRFHVPAGIDVVPSGSTPFEPAAPEDPPAPREYENPEVSRAPWDGRLRPSYRERGLTSMYNQRQSITPGPGGGTTVLHGVGLVGSRDWGETGELLLRFPRWDAARSFEVPVELLIGDSVATQSLLKVQVGR